MDKAIIQPIFAEIVCVYNDLQVDNNKLKSMYDKQTFKKTNQEDGHINFCSLSTDYHVLDKEVELQKYFLNIMNDFGVQVLKSKNNFKMTTSWFTKAETGEITTWHNHSNSMYSGVYYFDQPADELSKFKLEKPYISPFDVDVTEITSNNCKSYEFTFGNNSMILFPSYLRHKLMLHKYKQVRKSLAFNFIPVGVIGKFSEEMAIQ